MINLISHSDNTSDSNIDFSKIAINAAIALDNITLNRSYKKEAIEEFGTHGIHFLSQEIYNKKDIFILHNIFQNSDNDDLEDICEKAKLIFNKLLHFDKENFEVREIIKLREFCVNFSKSISIIFDSPFLCNSESNAKNYL